MALLTLAVLAILMLLIFRNKYRRSAGRTVSLPLREENDAELPDIPIAPALAPARIYLFGQFQVFDKTGEDISNLFTPVLRELFLLILIYTIRTGRGISAEELTEILWLEKNVKDAKNNRSVNMAKLKAILERLGESLLVRRSGFWQFQVSDDSIYIDYQKYQEMIAGSRNISWDYLKDLLGILKKGSFLTQTEYNWLDDVKVDISNAVIEICLKFIRDTETGSAQPEFVIELANCIFHFDQLNEYALEYKCRSLIQLKRLALAGKTYDKFIKDYKEMYGEDFNKSFQEIISAPSSNSFHK
jgi:two-component SAPR family response regulator